MAFTGTYVGLGIYLVITAILVILGGFWMKNEEKCFKGGLIALIFSIIGGGGLLGLIAGILGMIAGKKAQVHVAGVPTEGMPGGEAEPVKEVPPQEPKV